MCVVKTKALVSFKDDLCLCFRISRMLVFSCNGSNSELLLNSSLLERIIS